MKKRKEKHFDWDKFFESAKFEDVMRLQFREKLRWISCYSPCKKWFFLSSVDLDIYLENLDVDLVQSLLSIVKEKIEQRMRKRKFDDPVEKTMQIASALIDKNFLESLLCDLTDEAFQI